MSTKGKHDRDKSSSETSPSDPSIADANSPSPEATPSTPPADDRDDRKVSDNTDEAKSDKKRGDEDTDAGDAQDEEDESADDEDDDEGEDDESADDEDDDDEGEDDERYERLKAEAVSSHAKVAVRGAFEKGGSTGTSKGRSGRGVRPGTKSKVVRKNLDEVPFPSRKSEMAAGGVLAAGAYVALWIGYSIYSASVAAHHSSYFSNSAWAFATGLFLLLLAVMTWIRYDRSHLEARTATGTDMQPKSKATRSPSVTARSDAFSLTQASAEATATNTKKNIKLPHKAKYDLPGLVWAILVGGPVYVAYWWKAADVWLRMFATERPGLWGVFLVLFAITSVAVVYGLLPPSLDEERQRRMPVRRVVLLVMSPFAFVFGMLYLGAFYPPWP